MSLSQTRILRACNWCSTRNSRDAIPPTQTRALSEKQLSQLQTIRVSYDPNLTLREGHLDFVLPQRSPNHEQQVGLDIVGAVVDAFHPVLDLNVDSRISEPFNFDGSARSCTIVRIGYHLRVAGNNIAHDIEHWWQVRTIGH